jgi:hypothetical protein
LLRQFKPIGLVNLLRRFYLRSPYFQRWPERLPNTFIQFVCRTLMVALIAYLLLYYLKFLCYLSVSLQELMRTLQLNLFRTCKIQELFDPPDPVGINEFNSK